MVPTLGRWKDGHITQTGDGSFGDGGIKAFLCVGAGIGVCVDAEADDEQEAECPAHGRHPSRHPVDALQCVLDFVIIGRLQQDMLEVCRRSRLVALFLVGQAALKVGLRKELVVLPAEFD